MRPQAFERLAVFAAIEQYSACAGFGGHMAAVDIVRRP